MRPQETTRLYLVACSQSKQSTNPGFYCTAGGLYTGDLFKKSKAYVEALGVCWGIVSAKYGVLNPFDVIPTYEEQLTEAKARSNEYGATLLGSFDLFLDRYKIDSTSPIDLVVLAGANYREALKRFVLPLYPSISFSAPLASLGIGKQKQKLLQLTQEIKGGAR